MKVIDINNMIEAIKAKSSEEIEEELDKWVEKNWHNQELFKKVNNLIVDLYYSRRECEILGVDYVNMPYNDRKKLHLYACYIHTDDN